MFYLVIILLNVERYCRFSFLWIFTCVSRYLVITSKEYTKTWRNLIYFVYELGLTVTMLFAISLVHDKTPLARTQLIYNRPLHLAVHL